MSGKTEENFSSAESIYHSLPDVSKLDYGISDGVKDDTSIKDTPGEVSIFESYSLEKNNVPHLDEKIIIEEFKPFLKNDQVSSKNLDTNEDFDKYLKITKLHLLLPWISLCLYMFDIVSDLLLAAKYMYKRQWLYGGLTFTFVIIPALYVSLFVGRTWRWIVAKGFIWWPLLLPFWVFNLEPAVQYMKNFRAVRKYLKVKKTENVKQQRKYYDKFINGNRRVADLKYSEGLMEGVPQFTLQGYILLSTYPTLEFDDKLMLQIGSLTSSIIGLAVIIYVRHKIFLLAHGCTVTSFGRALWSSGRLFTLVPRVLSITALASIYTKATFSVIGAHWFLAAVWRYITHMKQLGYVEPIFQAGADTLVARVDTLRNNILSHAVMLTEDITMMVVWAFSVGLEYYIMRESYSVIVILLDIVGCVTDIVYDKYKLKFTTKIEEMVDNT